MAKAAKAVTDFTAAELAEFFSYLDALRDSGVTNMFGAAPYLKRAYRLHEDTARSVLQAWMRSFSTEGGPDARAASALAKSQAA